MRIGFFTDGLCFDGATIQRSSLGGSESAVYYMARELSRLQDEVWVFGNCKKPGTYDGVRYRHRRDFINAALALDFDVFIVSRFYSFFQVPFRSRVNILWNHDILDNKSGLVRFLPRIQALFNLSRFHVETYLAKIPELAGRIWQTRNGIDPSAVAKAVQGSAKIPGKMIYASRPERGLKLLLETIWPRLRARFPALELHICGYEVRESMLPPRIQEMYREIGKVARQTAGIRLLGNLPKADYYRHLAEAQLMLYPCNFPEISCIAALEAQACGTPIVTTRDFALPETVGASECLVEGLPAAKDYQDRFVAKVEELLTSPAVYRASACEGSDWVFPRYTWPFVAREWRGFFEDLLQKGGRSPIGAG